MFHKELPFDVENEVPKERKEPEFFDKVLQPVLVRKTVAPFNIQTSVYNCHACSLQEYHKPLTLEESNADLMIIGQEPHDVLIESPQGKILHEILNQYHFNQNDIYYTSSVKCAQSKDFDKCHHHLVSEMISVEPLMVIALGYHAAAPFMEHLAKADQHHHNGGNLTPGDGYTLINGSDMMVTNRIQDVEGNQPLFHALHEHFQLAQQRYQHRKNQRTARS
jgi:hypothetical protein